MTDRRVSYAAGALAWLAVLPLAPTWLTWATLLVAVPPLVVRAYRAGSRIRIPLLDRERA